FVNKNADAGDSSKFVRVYPLGEAPADNRFMLEQKISLEPLGINALFAAKRPVVLKGPFSPIHRDRYTDAISAQGLGGRVLYSVKSDISVPSEQELRTDSGTEYPDYVHRLYLQLPPIDSRIRQLANKIVSDADARTTYDKVRAIEAHLKTKFSYTLDLKPMGKDPLAEFLFDLREGHCEYFATALAVMLRSIGIPARVVNGFQMGEYNQISGLYTVRDSDAHSWVEVYFPHLGVWVEFDATPAAGLNDYSQGGLLAQLRQYMDALEVFWLDYVVTLDGDEQASMMAEIQKRLLKFRDGAYSYYKSVKEWFRSKAIKFLIERKWDALSIFKLIGAVVFLGAAILGAYISVAHRRRKRLAPTGYGPWWHRWLIVPLWRRKLRSTSDHQASAVLFYEQMLAIASRARLIKQPDQTPMEFAASSGINEIEEITRAYNRVRFGGARLDEQEARRVSEHLAELKRAVRKRKSRKTRNRL
ncbi:MAG TPA: transglutaminase domain-containing protein, partial [Blastocatellia bacterium]